MTTQRQLAAEGLGTALLTMITIGSGLMSQRLGSSPPVALMSSAFACGLGLFALLACFGKISGAHFNPVLTLSESWRGQLPLSLAAGYVVSQCIGAFAGVATAHLMFDVPLFEAAVIARSDLGQWASEFIATFGLIGVCIGSARQRGNIAPFAVAFYVIAAFWFTPSSAFTNPAITLAKAATASPAGIRLSDVPGFVLAQLSGGLASAWLFGWLYPKESPARPAGIPSLMPVASLKSPPVQYHHHAGKAFFQRRMSKLRSLEEI